MDSANETFESLANDYIERNAGYSPVWATVFSGDHRYDHKLDEVNRAGLGHIQAFYEEMLARLRNIEVDELSSCHRVDAALLKNRLEYDRWRLTELQEWAWNPLYYIHLAGASIEGPILRDSSPLDERLSALAARLKDIPRLLARVRGVLDPVRVPLIHAETAAEKNRHVAELLDLMIKPLLNDAMVGPELRTGLRTAILVAASALNRHQRWLEKVLLPAAKGEFRLGRSLFDRKFELMLQSELSRQEVLLLAWKEFQSVRDEMYELAVSIHKLRCPDLAPSLPKDPEPEARSGLIRAALLLAYERELEWDVGIKDTVTGYVDRIKSFVIKQDLLSVPQEECKVILMPAYRRGVWVAHFNAPAPLDPSQKGYCAVTLPPEDWSIDRRRSFLRENNSLMLQNLTMHEAIPGHFLQVNRANSHESKLRRVLPCDTFIEGWAVYAESLIVEAGYLQDGKDPMQGLLMKLIDRKSYLKAVINAIIDQGIHTSGMEREEALRLMMEGAFQERPEAEAKWTRCQLNSVQLSSYFVGFQELKKLRRSVELEQGGAFDLKRYHDELLSFGSPPVHMVKALMLGKGVSHRLS